MARFNSIANAGARLGTWASARLTPKQLLIVLTFIVGALAGVGAWLLKLGISTVGDLLTAHHSLTSPNYYYLGLPVIGIVLCACFCRYIIRANIEFGCERVHDALLAKQYRMRASSVFSSIIACSITLGFGGTAGSEGPIAYTGAGIGSNLGRLFGLPDQQVRALIICGAGAGIAAIFKSPIGGAIFSLEVLALPVTLVTVLALICGCLTASTVAYLLSGSTLDIGFTPAPQWEPSMTLAVVCLGVFCGIYSLYYSWFLGKTEDIFKRMKSPWLKNVISGLMLGGMVFLFPVLYGDGYGIIGHVINGHDSGLLAGSVFLGMKGPWVVILFVAGTLALKSIGTAATNAGGGVGGEFAPTLFAGCMAGLLFSLLAKQVLGIDIPAADFAFFGMAGVMAGAIQAPLMAIFIVAEMAGYISMLFPLTVTALLSYATVRSAHLHLHIDSLPTWLHHGQKVRHPLFHR